MRESIPIVAVFLSASLQGLCALVLVYRDWRGQHPNRAWYALAWCALVGAAYVASVVWYPDWSRVVDFLQTAEATALDRPGMPRSSMALPELAAIHAISGVLVSLWLLVATLQYRGGRVYRAALRATLLPSAIVGLVSGLWLMGFAFVVLLLAFLALLTRLGW